MRVRLMACFDCTIYSVPTDLKYKHTVSIYGTAMINRRLNQNNLC